MHQCYFTLCSSFLFTSAALPYLVSLSLSSTDSLQSYISFPITQAHREGNGDTRSTYVPSFFRAISILPLHWKVKGMCMDIRVSSDLGQIKGNTSCSKVQNSICTRLQVPMCFFLPAPWRSLHMPSRLLEVLRWWKTLCQTSIWYLSTFSLPKPGRTVFNQERMGSLLLREGISVFSVVKSKDHAETTLKANSQALPSEGADSMATKCY